MHHNALSQCLLRSRGGALAAAFASTSLREAIDRRESPLNLRGGKALCSSTLLEFPHPKRGEFFPQGDTALRYDLAEPCVTR